MYPYNYKRGQIIQTDISDVVADRGFIAHISWADPAAPSATAICAAVTLPESGTLEITSGITNPDYSRALCVKGNAAGISGNVVIEGTNEAGEPISETIAANGTNQVNGNKAFKTVTKITFPARNAEGDTISVGTTGKLGLPYKLAHNTVIAACRNNVRESTAPTVAVDADALENNTVLLSSALNGTQIDVYLIV